MFADIVLVHLKQDIVLVTFNIQLIGVASMLEVLHHTLKHFNAR